MANLLNALPQANAKILPGSSAVEGKISGKAGAEDGVAFQADLAQAEKKVSTKEQETAALRALLQQGTATLPQKVEKQIPTDGGEEVTVQGREAKRQLTNLQAGLDGENALMAGAPEAKVQNSKQKNVPSPEVIDAATQQALQNRLPQIQESMIKDAAQGNMKPSVNPAGLSEQNIQNLAMNSEMNPAMVRQAIKDQSGVPAQMVPMGEHADFDVTEAPVAKTPVSSKLSTSDYLNLREISQFGQKNMNASPLAQGIASHGDLPALQNTNAATLALGTGALGTTALKVDGRKAKDLNGKEAAIPLSASVQGRGQNQKMVEAPVTQGTAGKTILSHDAIHQISQQVNILAQAKQDGEIRIRLRPDHLGELKMHVRTDGQKVSIEIQAQDGNAKRIIEESLGSLRDGLGSHQLILSRIDVGTAPMAATLATDPQLQMDLGSFRQHTDSGNSQQFGQQSSEQRGTSAFMDEAPRKTLRAAAAMASVSNRNDAGRLDMIA